MYDSVSINIIKRFHYEKSKLYLLIDDAYNEIAQSIQMHHTNTEIVSFSSCIPENVSRIFELPSAAVVLLLAEPKTFVNYRLFQYLDFSNGEPQIKNTSSRVLIFPRESICRIFSEDSEKDFSVRDKIITEMKANQKYRITTAAGTDLIFESRYWIPLDFEVCTAPVEESINGVIAVDGALFFKAIDDKVIFEIHNGKIHSITASSPKGEQLVSEYRNMTEREMEHQVNKQLAEIGIGFCNGAIISDSFMEAETVANTCHFCFGNNICYGGSNESEFHGASVLIKNPVFEQISIRE